MHNIGEFTNHFQRPPSLELHLESKSIAGGKESDRESTNSPQSGIDRFTKR